MKFINLNWLGLSLSLSLPSCFYAHILIINKIRVFRRHIRLKMIILILPKILFGTCICMHTIRNTLSASIWRKIMAFFLLLLLLRNKEKSLAVFHQNHFSSALEWTRKHIEPNDASLLHPFRV